MSARLTIISTRPVLAVADVLGLARAPAWCALISDPRAVDAIADGARCIAVFYESRKYRSALEWAWIERRKRGGVLGLAREDIDRLADWCCRHGAQTDVSALSIPEIEGLVVSERRAIP